MLHRPISRALFSGAALLTLMTVPGPARADILTETIYVPTGVVVSVPTSSVLATSYVVPTSSVLATSYVVPTAVSTTVLPTSTIYVSDPVLIPTSTTYYRTSIVRPRRYVERTSYYIAPTAYYVPTSTIVPTTYVSTSSIVPTTYLSSTVITPTSYVIDNGVVTTSASYPCDTVTTVPPPKTTANRGSNGNSGATIVSEPINGGTSNERKPSATLNSTPSGDDGIPSNVTPPVPAPVATPPAPKPAGNATTGGEEPPVLDPSKLPAATGNSNDKVQVPPPGTTGAPPNETTYRNARRPIYDTRNILRGLVISSESKRPVEGVTVIASSLTNAFADRPTLTDADGEFKISLPDGDWTVKVKMPSGSIYTVGRDYVTAGNGKVTDPSGRPVAEFKITR